jgi:ABC-type arginine transport system ATPase subunit
MFNKLILEGRPILSSAKLAVTPHSMLTAIRDDRSSVGILPQHWNLNHEVFEQAIVAKVPVLAITKNQPAGLVKELLACLQK